MIITNMLGGIGNQLYQYAIGKAMSILNNDKLYIDIKHVENYKHQHQHRGYSLGNFNTVQNFNFSNDYRIIKENTSICTYDPNVFYQKGNLYLNGYWQSYKYFDDIKEVLYKELTLRNGFSKYSKEIEKIINSTNSVSFHVRRGDKVQPNKLVRFPFYGAEYFEKAKDIINTIVDTPTYFIFSDDIEWCKENIKADKIIYVDKNIDKMDEDLMLMSMCKHNIIVASSFSWWAAYLNKNPNKIVITPSKWYNDLKYNIDDYNLKGWRVLE